MGKTSKSYALFCSDIALTRTHDVSIHHKIKVQTPGKEQHIKAKNS